MREMLGGCCVCSDDRGWSENPLVYCDGQFCNVAVHQACYGIVSVPTGPWYCCKCESQERSNKVKCELCPSKHGALKRTDNQGWAHVVCALYIPEVRFGNVSTMEPIQLHLIPQERFSKVCYICKEKGKPANSTVGACMQCNRVGCKQQFHVTCAQSLGLLCEEAGNYLDNVKYCGYCQHHYSKLKKGGNVKTIPPYKPVNESQNSDSNSEKESETLKNSPSHMSSKRKSGSSSKNSSSSKSTTNSGKTSSSQQQKTIHSNIESAGEKRLSNSLKSAKSSEEATAATTTATPSSSPSGDKSDKKDSRSDSISDPEKDSKDINNKSVSGNTSSSNKKRKSNNSRTPTPIQSEVSVVVSALSASDLSNMNIACSTIASSSSSTTTTTTSATVAQKTSSSSSSSSLSLNEGTTAEKLKRAKLESTQLIISNQPVVALTSISTTKIVTSSSAANNNTLSDSVAHIQVLPAAVPSTASIIQTSSSSSTSTQQHPSLLVSVPLSNASIAPLTVTSSSGSASFATDKMQQNISERNSSSSAISNIIISSNNQGILTSEMSGGGLKITYEKQPIDSGHTEVDMELELDAPVLVQEMPSKRIARSHSHDKSERGKGKKRHSLGSNGFPTMQGSTSMPATLNKKSTNNNNNNNRSMDQSYPNPPMLSVVQPGAFAAISQDKLKDSPPSSPNSESQGIIPTSVMRGRTKGRKSAPAAVNVIQGRSKDDKKDVKIFQNGINTAPHMLGNQLNPTSNMHQKMTDHLSNELEAHSIYNNSNDGSPTLIGPQLHHRILQSARASSTGSSTASGGSGLSSMLGNGGGTIPQTLDQLLERQWEQGSQFLMEQAQHFDIASLLSCLHQLRAENLRLEEHVSSLLQRRDHLLAVNARLAIPLTGQPAVVPNSQSSHTVNNIHPSLTVNHAENMSRTPRLGVGSYDRYPQGTLTVPVENGLTPDSYSNNLHNNRDSVSSGQPSPNVRHSPAAPYSNNGLLRQCPDPGRERPSAPRPHSYTVYERPGSSHSASSSTPQMVIRRERDREHDIFGHTSQQPS